MVLDLTANKQIDVELLDKILVEVEIISNIDSKGESCETEDSGSELKSSLERTSQSEVLVEILGNVLQQVKISFQLLFLFIYLSNNFLINSSDVSCSVHL